MVMMVQPSGAATHRKQVVAPIPIAGGKHAVVVNDVSLDFQ